MLTRQEKGCLRCDILEDDEDVNKFYTIRAFKDVHTLMAHRKTEHYLAWDRFKNSSGCVLLDNKSIHRGLNYQIAD